jgi:hypothetical protein
MVSRNPTFQPRLNIMRLRIADRKLTPSATDRIGNRRTRCDEGEHANAHMDGTHPCLGSRAYGRIRFVGNREMPMKRGDRVASILEPRWYDASAKLELSPQPRASWRLNPDAADLALE